MNILTMERVFSTFSPAWNIMLGGRLNWVRLCLNTWGMTPEGRREWPMWKTPVICSGFTYSPPLPVLPALDPMADKTIRILMILDYCHCPDFKCQCLIFTLFLVFVVCRYWVNGIAFSECSFLVYFINWVLCLGDCNEVLSVNRVQSQ